MSFCPQCGSEVVSGDQFCSSCGSPLKRGGRRIAQDRKAPGELPGQWDSTIVQPNSSSFSRRLGRAFGSHRGPTIGVTVVAGVAVVALAIMLLTRDSQPDCYSTAITYGDLARRVDYSRIEGVRDQMDVEVEDDDHRRAANLAINFVASSKILGGETYPSRSELEGFIRTSACRAFSE